MLRYNRVVVTFCRRSWIWSLITAHLAGLDERKRVGSAAKRRGSLWPRVRPHDGPVSRARRLPERPPLATHPSRRAARAWGSREAPRTLISERRPRVTALTRLP